MAVKELYIDPNAIQMVEVDGAWNIPTVVFYKPGGGVLIGNSALAEASDPKLTNEDFKIDLGRYAPGTKGKRRYVTAAGDKTAMQLADDFLYELQKVARQWLLVHGIKECKYPEDRIYFLDATHPQHNTKPSFGWIYKGDTKTIKGNSGRKRINLNGALSLEDMDITVLEEETINTQAMIRLFTELEGKQKTGTLYAIVDNASYNHSKELKAYILKLHRFATL